jgi:acyl carrier protein
MIGNTMSITVDLASIVLEYLQQRQHELGLSVRLEPATAVFSTGLLDSIALMDLIATVEQATHQTVDMLRFDPSDVETAAELVSALSSALAG